MFLKGISPRHGSKWAPTIFHALDHLICLLTKEISEIATLCVILKSNLYIYIYRYIYMIITKTLYLPNPIAYHDVFWPQTRAQFSIVGQCLLCTVFQKTLVSVFPFWLPPHFWEMFSLWTDYPHLSLQGGTPPVINWLFACTAMKTSSIYHLNQHQSEIGLHKQTAI